MPCDSLMKPTLLVYFQLLCQDATSSQVKREKKRHVGSIQPAVASIMRVLGVGRRDVKRHQAAMDEHDSEKLSDLSDKIMPIKQRARERD